jgi:hypothetical protein
MKSMTPERIAELRKLRHAGRITSARDGLVEALLALESAHARIERLRAALEDAADGLAESIAYASPYFRAKWGLDSYLARARAALEEDDR